MSISVRSLGIVAVVLVGLLAWVLWGSAVGPRPALAESLAPFPSERPPARTTDRGAIVIDRLDESVDVSGNIEQPPGEAELFETAVMPVISSRVNGDLNVGVPVISDLNNVVLTFQASAPQWRADSNGDGELDELDIAEFGELWSWADTRADFNADGVVDPDDYAAFVDAFDSREQNVEESRVIYLGREFQLNTNIRFEGGVQIQLQVDQGGSDAQVQQP